MLITRPRRELTPSYIREFCRRFDEGLRVEYKSDLTSSVRTAIPKVISSFANSYGGVLIIGVSTVDGKVIDPIAGFEKPNREELPLTIENLCLGNVYPTLIPLVTEVESDVVGKTFLIIEVDASSEAPHAIENSRKVFVRTGRASDPYDLADIDLIERLIKRRENVLRVRSEFVSEAAVLLQRFCEQPAYPKVRVVISPRFPHSVVADRDRLFQFLRDSRYRGGHFYNRDQFRRVPRGVCATRNSQTFGYLDHYGQVFHQEVVECRVDGAMSAYRISELLHPVLQAITCAAELYKIVGHRCDLHIGVRAFDLEGHTCVDYQDYTTDIFQPNVTEIPADYFGPSEHLSEAVPAVITTLLHQLLWSMDQGHESLSEAHVRRVVDRILSKM